MGDFEGVSGDFEGVGSGDFGGVPGDGGFSSLGEWLFSGKAAMLGFASSGVCSLGISGAVVFCRNNIFIYKEQTLNK